VTLTVRVDELMRPSASLFGYFVLDTSTLDGVATLAPISSTVDISSDVRTVSTTRGKQRDLDEYGMGSAACELNNQSRRYDPTNTASIYYGNIAPMRSVYVTAVLDGVDYPMFRGYIERWRVDYSQQNLPLASIDALDGFLLLSRAEMLAVASAYSGDLAGDRISRVLNLDEVNFPVDVRSIATGLTTMGATTLGETALPYLQKVARSEGGAVFVSKTGVLTFEQRNTAPGSSLATFSDDGAGSSIKYLTIDQDTGTDLLYNRVVASGTTGTVQSAEDTISQSDNQIVATLDRTGQLALNDADMLDQAKWLVAKYATAETRLRQVTVAVQSLSAARQAEVLALELGDRVTVTRTPPGGGSPATISQAAIVIGISHDIRDGGRNWLTTFTFSAGKRAIGFVLDDADLGQLDDDFFAY
jgi:hypothetical protein